MKSYWPIWQVMNEVWKVFSKSKIWQCLDGVKKPEKQKRKAADTGNNENKGGETKKRRTFNTVAPVTVHNTLFYYLSTL